MGNNTAVTKRMNFFHFQSFSFLNKSMSPFLH